MKLTAHRPLPGRPTAGAHCAGPRSPGPFAQDPEQGLGNADCSPSDPDTRLAEPAHPDLTVLTPALGAASATGDRGHTRFIDSRAHAFCCICLSPGGALGLTCSIFFPGGSIRKRGFLYQ